MRQIDAGSVQPFGGGNQMNDPKKMSVPVCCICQKVINGDAEWIRTKRGTVLYMHRECVRKETNGISTGADAAVRNEK